MGPPEIYHRLWMKNVSKHLAMMTLTIFATVKTGAYIGLREEYAILFSIVLIA
ncbi:MAG TPA: hypothetical protein VK722_14725 [Candidatus Aquilonibacter sp.]|jgi:hypothetical protein|nr:hypothetical protein [Candidatus Aquilonibacter sp.]